jgi:DNA-binding transcriptional ArsR family regulator
MPYPPVAHDTVLAALGDPTRRRILELLRAAPCPVGELADQLPVSRPAVSQHLKVLAETRLVEAEARGTRRVYSVRPEGLEPLRVYLDTFWGDALRSFQSHVRRRTKEKRK